MIRDSDQTEGRRIAHGEAEAIARRDLAMAKHPATLVERDSLAQMLNAWAFWGKLEPSLQSELLDCIEHVYSGRLQTGGR